MVVVVGHSLHVLWGSDDGNNDTREQPEAALRQILDQGYTEKSGGI